MQKNLKFIFCAWIIISLCVVWFAAYIFDGFITYDGYYYYEMSTAFRQLKFENWDFARTPIFPYLLYLSERFNLTALPNFVFLNSVLIFLSMALLIDLLIKKRPKSKRPFLIVVGALLPSVVVYQHGLLSEASLIFLMTVIFWISAKEWSTIKSKYIALTIVMIVAYYVKPHFKYYAIGVFLLNLIVIDFNNFRFDRFRELIYSLRWLVIGLLVFFICIQPWEKALKNSGRMAALNFFPLMMGVVPPYEKYVGPKYIEYNNLLNSAGGVPREGFEHSLIYPFVGATSEMLLWPAIKSETDKYLFAVAKSLSVYAYSTLGVSETHNFYTSMKSGDQYIGKIKLYHFDGRPELANDVYSSYANTYAKNGGQLIYSYVYQSLRFLETVMIIFSLVLLICAVYIRDKIIVLGLTISWSYMLMHALALLAIDRYAAPIKLIVLYCFAAFPVRMFWDAIKLKVHACKNNILYGKA